jgi:hypothetical protein
MFDRQTGGPDAAATLSLVSQAHRLVLEQECALVELATHWADLHHPDSQPQLVKPLPGVEQGRPLGGQGTPEVLEFAAAELGARMETTVGSARALMADALDLRHRLPELWQLILAGAVPVWRARKVALATRHLNRDSAMQVDAAVAPSIVGLPWGRFETLMHAKIIEADPQAAEERAKIWEAERFVRAGRTGQSGLKLLIAKANAGDVIWFMVSAAPRRSASWRSPRVRCSCSGSSGTNSTPKPNPSSPRTRSTMHRTRRLNPPQLHPEQSGRYPQPTSCARPSRRRSRWVRP